MKYGQALYERSVPQWAPYNIDYNELKALIRTQTTPKLDHEHQRAEPLAIPGQSDGNDDEETQRFEALFARELGAQHARVDLFVRSKADEFRRRLRDYEQKVNRLIARGDPDSAGLMTSRRLERLARLESRVLRCTDDIRNLDRFIQAQRIGFQKILKKYRKRTGSTTLPRLTDPFLSPSTSFTHLDLSQLYTSFTDLSARIRAYSPTASSSGSSSPLTVSRRSSQPTISIPPPLTPTKQAQPQPQTRSKAAQTAAYWNEYDYPSDGRADDEPYTISIDPNTPSFPLPKPLSHAFSYISEKASPLLQWTIMPSSTAGERRALLAKHSGTDTPNSSSSAASAAAATTTTIDDDNDYESTFPVGYETHYATFPSLATQRLAAQRHRLLLLILCACYVSALLFLLISAILVTTGRHRMRAEVDVGVVAGVVASLGFLGVGVGVGMARWEGAGRWERGVVVVGFVAGCLGAGAVLVGVLGE